MCQTGNENCHAVAEYLIRCASKPFFEILSQWINRGMIVDHGKVRASLRLHWSYPTNY